MQDRYTEDAIIFKALCDEKRLRIIALLKNQEKCACSLIEDMQIGQSSLSYHMKILCESGIITSRQDGKWTHYPEGCAYALKRLQKILAGDD